MGVTCTWTRVEHLTGRWLKLHTQAGVLRRGIHQAGCCLGQVEALGYDEPTVREAPLELGQHMHV